MRVSASWEEAMEKCTAEPPSSRSRLPDGVSTASKAMDPTTVSVIGGARGYPGSTDSRGASPPSITARTDRPRSEGNHPEDARPIVPGGAHDAEASTDD